MKKLQFVNIFFIILLTLFMIFLLGYSFRQGWPIKEIILAGLIFFVIFLSIAIKFYRKNMEENGWIKTACWISIAIAIFCFILMIVVAIDASTPSHEAEDWGPLMLFVGTLILWPLVEIILGILFIIGYLKARNIQLSKN